MREHYCSETSTVPFFISADVIVNNELLRAQ